GDFRFGPTLGEGSYSTVILAREIESGREYAMKVLEKRHIMREKKVPQVEREKQVLSRLDHPFFVRLYFTFQDTERLYFGLSVARKGELLSKIKQLGKFDLECSRFYTAQIVSALQHLHSLNIIHRDLKPENILFNDKMQIQITDFGTAKELKDSGDEPRSSSFVGTAQYVSPELLKDKKACKSSDLWALGCIVYQMLTGQFPFKAPNEYLIFQQIVNCKYEFPEDFDPNARDLISSLLQLDPMMRLGSSSCGGYEKLMEHPFFTGIDWENLANQAAPKTMLALAGDSSDEDTTVEDLADGFDQAFINDFKAQVIEESKQKGVRIKKRIHLKCLSMSLTNKLYDMIKIEIKKSILFMFLGQLEKKRGFSVKLREFLLTEGPKLIYIDPNSKEVKGEIPWSSELRTEPKSFRIFFVHTPNRTYHLIDKSNNALIWCKKIEEIKKHYYT
uniref:3-phosphoinositide-dependent protein kinase 1 n=1 Tax=Ciona savignyi TaxID=51511 RepID=H2YFH2_CIOSA